MAVSKNFALSIILEKNVYEIKKFNYWLVHSSLWQTIQIYAYRFHLAKTIDTDNIKDYTIHDYYSFKQKIEKIKPNSMLLKTLQQKTTRIYHK